MLDPDGLNVWCDQQLVGYLWRDFQGLLGFRYDREWLAQGRFAISQSLPLQEVEFPPESWLADRFFANLLPEGRAREQIVRTLKITDTNFNLLRAIGGECAGALSLLQSEQQPLSELKYHKIPNHELARLVASQAPVHSWVAKDRPRLSMAGAQNKCPVLLKDDGFWLPAKESPSSHILKFESQDYRHLPAYETYTTLLADAVGLQVVAIQLRSMAKKHYALVERYDRYVLTNGEFARLHQEDFCQALGVAHIRKYQEDGGPTFADCLHLVQKVSSDPANDMQQLLRWQVFNVLAGNSDGHAKNLALLYQANGDIRLAPFYDLICTRAIARIDYHLAFSVGDERNPGMVTLKHWDSLAEQCGVRPRFLRDLVLDVATRLLTNLRPVRENFERLYGKYESLQRIEQIVYKQCQRTIKQ